MLTRLLHRLGFGSMLATVLLVLGIAGMLLLILDFLAGHSPAPRPHVAGRAA